jgi:hypothetical protein
MTVTPADATRVLRLEIAMRLLIADVVRRILDRREQYHE